MTAAIPITSLFLDLGGVMLTNGWDRNSRRRAAESFGLDYGEMDERHHLTFDTYESGKLGLDEYLHRIVFYEPRPFSVETFKQFMFAQSQPFPQMLDLVKQLKVHYGLHVAVVSNEARELAEYRIRAFHLNDLADFFIISSFVHFRKPDRDIFQLALDVAQVPAPQVLYLEDRAMFVEVARSMGIQAIRHTSYEQTRAALADAGLAIP